VDIEPAAAANRASGNRALVSYDKKIFVKTIQSEQVAAMHSILKEYHQVTTSLTAANIVLSAFLWISAFQHQLA